MERTMSICSETDAIGKSPRPSMSVGNPIEESEMFDIAMSSSIQTNPDGDHYPLPGQIKVRFMQSLRRVRSMTLHSIHEVPSDDRNNSSIVAGWNVSNIIQGIGILGIPYAVRMGGWTAVVLIVLTAALCCFTGQILIDCLYEVCPVNNVRLRIFQSYSCIGEKAWPRFGRQLVNIVSMMEMFGGLTLYIILLSVMSSTLMKHFIPELDIYYWSVITTYATLPLLFVTRMSIVSWFSLIAVVALVATISTVFAFCFTLTSQMAINHVPSFDIATFPVCFGIIVFSYCAHAVFPCIEASMKSPKEYPTMMNTSFSIAAISKAALGLLAVLIFGNETMQEFTGNMEQNIYFSNAVCILVFINVFFSVPLVIYVICEKVDVAFLPHFHSSLHSDGKLSPFWIILTRSIILSSSLLTAMLVPHFALLMGFVGSLTGTCLSFVFPCLFHISLKRKNLSSFGIAFRIIIAALGICFGIIGAAFSLKEIVSTYIKA